MNASEKVSSNAPQWLSMALDSRGDRTNQPAKLVRVGVYLTDERRQQLLLRAIAERTSATKLVERLIAGYLDLDQRSSVSGRADSPDTLKLRPLEKEP